MTSITKQVYHLRGLSTDTKPVLADMATGSTYEELDTGLVFIFNAVQNAWLLHQAPPPRAPMAVGIRAISKTSSIGNVDTYTIYYTNGTQTTFTVTNGINGTDGKDGIGSKVGYGLQISADESLEIDSGIVTTWNKLVANKAGSTTNNLTSIDINGILYKVGTGTGVGLKSVTLTKDNILVFTLADDSTIECSLQQLVDTFETKLADLETKVNAVDGKLENHSTQAAEKFETINSQLTQLESDLDNLVDKESQDIVQVKQDIKATQEAVDAEITRATVTETQLQTDLEALTTNIAEEATTREDADNKLREELKITYVLISESVGQECTLANHTVYTYNNKSLTSLNLF